MSYRLWVLTILLVMALEGADRPLVGTNLSGLNDWSDELTFVDAFKNSRPWFSGTRTEWQDTRPIDVDERGWVRSLQPGQWARTLMFWGVPTGLRFPAGRYVVEYEGSGTIEYGGGARRVSSLPGRDVLEVDPTRDGIGLFITSVDPMNYLRNIHVWMPDADSAGDTFYSMFLDRIKNYKVIRFMHWMLGQNVDLFGDFNRTQAWSERPTLDDARWTVKGAPLEIMIALANRTGANPWFTISHLADDDYVRHFAEMIRDRLDPSLKAYVEHSDEVWNGQYPQARYATQQGLALGLSDDANEAQARYHALRSTRIFSIFEDVVGTGRIVRVLGSFTDNQRFSEAALSFLDTAAHTDALAIAPYFGPQSAQEQSQARNMTVDQLMDALAGTYVPAVLRRTSQQVSIANRYGIPLVAYEGGQSLVGLGQYFSDPVMNDLFDAANRDSRMGAIYTQYLNGWVDAGGQLFVHYTNCGRYGQRRFGSLEHIDQPREQAPKYDALQRFIEGN